MNLKFYLQNKLEKTIISIWPIVNADKFLLEVNYPPDKKFGDYTTNIAMKLALLVHKSPMEIADHIKREMGKTPAFNRVEVVPPGFLNFYLKERWLARQVNDIVIARQGFGKSVYGRGVRVQVEFISANPTGPLHLGNGRGGFAGDVLANILKLAGYTVQREYYINNIGNQINILAESVLRRYWKHKGIKIEYPDYCYKGKYIDELAKKLFLPNYKLSNSEKMEVIRDKIKDRILQRMVSSIKQMADKKLKIKFDKWFLESSLYSSGQIDAVLQVMKGKNLLYKFEGAIWLKTHMYGDEKDRVLIKADEDPVYFLSDIAYHWNKLAIRKFDKVIDIWGADHHGYVNRMQAAMKIFGHEGKLDIIIAQLVRLISRGEEIKMSKRSGTFITLDELVDEVGIDATRFFFLMHDFNTHMDFDLDLAKKKTKDNPVFYVQYAHARICSIIKKAKKLKLKSTNKKANQGLEAAEQDLIRELIKWPELILDVAKSYQVHRLSFYAIDLATSFHNFYTKCQVISDNEVIEHRLKLVKATRVVLQNVLAAMGISAPERM